MVEKVNNKIKEGRKQIDAVIILCWICIIVLVLAWLAVLPGGRYFGLIPEWGNINNILPVDLDVITRTLPFALVLLYIFELIGLNRKKAYAVRLGRAVLIVTMIIFFPIGTIFGAVFWKRFRHQKTKKYLNYGR